MTMVGNLETDEALIAAARQMLNQSKRRSERVCYYRTPQFTPDGRKHVQAGWIIWGDTQDSIKLANIARGYIPLEQYGYIRPKARDEDPDTPFDKWGQWGLILSTPEGVREFPKDQILAYHWYDADRLRFSLHGDIPPTLKVRDGNVLWPQLAGADFQVFGCPECNDQRWLLAVHLARHLRIWHDYDQASIMMIGEQYGVDFSAEFAKDGRVLRKLRFDAATDDEPAVDPDEPAGFNLTIERPKVPRKGQ